MSVNADSTPASVITSPVPGEQTVPAPVQVVATPESAKVAIPDTPPREGHTTFSFENDSLRKEDFIKIVPDDFKEKPWVQNLMKNETPTKEMFRQFEEAQKLIGSRPQGLVPPDANATPEQVKSFYKALGVPDDIKQYVVEPLQLEEADKKYGDLIQKNRSDYVLDEMRKAAQEEGLNPKQFKNMAQRLDKSQVKFLKDVEATQAQNLAKQQAEFGEKLKSQFGDKWDQVVVNGRKLIDLYVPEEVKKSFPTFDNGQGLALAVALNHIHNGLVKGETFTGTNGIDSGITAPTRNIDTVRADTRALMSTKAFTDFQHPDHKSTIAKVRQLQDSLSDFIKK